MIRIAVEAVNGSAVGCPGTEVEDEIHLLFPLGSEMAVGPTFWGGGVVVVKLIVLIVAVEKVIDMPWLPRVCNFGFELDD